MARITVEDCLEKEPNRFALVQLAAKRTKQILGGSKILISDERDNKSVVTALREIAAGEVQFMTEEDLREAEERALREREAMEIQEPVSEVASGFPGGVDVAEEVSENAVVVEEPSNSSESEPSEPSESDDTSGL